MEMDSFKRIVVEVQSWRWKFYLTHQELRRQNPSMGLIRLRKPRQRIYHFKVDGVNQVFKVR